MNVGPPNGFHLKTPLIRSDPLSKIAGRDVYLKLDNLQPSGVHAETASVHELAFHFQSIS